MCYSIKATLSLNSNGCYILLLAIKILSTLLQMQLFWLFNLIMDSEFPFTVLLNAIKLGETLINIVFYYHLSLELALVQF